MAVEVIVLGSGDASGTPKPGCTIKACAATNGSNNRSRFSLFIKASKCNILVGAAPDLRQQFLREGISLKEVDCIFLTHAHYDQTGGLGEFDAIGNRPSIKLFCASRVLDERIGYFDYLFDKKRVVFNPLEINRQTVTDNFAVTPFELNHYKCFCMGFRLVIDRKIIVIAVDSNADLKPESLELMKGADLLILDGMAESLEEILLAKRDLSGQSDKKFKATVDPNKRGHMLISEAIELSKKLHAKQTILSHICHFNSPHKQLKAKYETKKVAISFDGMKLKL